MFYLVQSVQFNKNDKNEKRKKIFNFIDKEAGYIKMLSCNLH